MKHFVADPIQAFVQEFAGAVAEQVPQPEAMALATVNQQGTPAVRMVLYKGIIRGGFSFYTNYQSPKAEQLNSAGKASVVFFWPVLNQQVRVTGNIEKLSAAESEEYFQSRPRLSQIGAWASEQSQKITSLEELEAKVEALSKKFEGKPIPRPEHWGGYLLSPTIIEFWYGKEGRLHERYVYERSSLTSSWSHFLRSP